MIKKTLFLAFALSFTITSYCQGNHSQKLDTLFKFYQKQNLFNGSVLVSQKGKILLEKGYGLKNAQSQTINDANSIFQIYSVTKTFTSTVILKLVELKKLSLTDKLSKFYPDFPKGDSITIEHLLTHASGIYDGDNMPVQNETSLVTFLKTKPLDFLPGTQWNYSNSGYRLLGYIIEKVVGISYEKAVKKYIFNPLQMTHSGFDFKYLLNKDKTTGYEIFSEKMKKPAIVYEPPGPFAAGGIYSTIKDLYKYYKGLSTYKLLSKQTLDKAYTPFKNNYGYGWIILPVFDKLTIGHSGAAAGFRSNFIQIPTDDVCIVLLSNTENELDKITSNVEKVLYNKPFKIPVVINISKEQLKLYRGTYEINNSLVIYVYVENSKLIVQPSKQPKNILYPEKQNLFYVEELNSYIHFEKNHSNEIDTLIFNQEGQDVKAKRIYPSWEIIGSSTENGWDGLGLKLSKTDTVNIWAIKNIQLKDGEIKFRFNRDWTINLGINSGNVLKQDGENIKIENGNYNIILDLTDDENPKYKISKQN